MIVTETQILNRALNENYLRENTDVYNEACRILLQAGNIKAKEMLDEAFRKMKNFIEITDVTNVNAYKKAKKEADTAKHMFASVLNQLHLIKAKEQDSKLSELDANVLRNTNDIDELRTEQERIKIEIVEIKEQQKKDREQQIKERDKRDQENLENKVMLNKILEAQNINARNISQTNEDLRKLQEEVKNLDQRLTNEIKELGLRVDRVEASIKNYVEQNKSTLKERLERAIANQGNQIKFSAGEYFEVMRLLHMVEELGFEDGKEMVSRCRNKISAAFSDYLVVITSDIVDAGLHGLNYKTKSAHLAPHADNTAQALFGFALKSLYQLHPSSEVLSMAKDALFFVGHTGLFIAKVASNYMEGKRELGGVKATADEMANYRGRLKPFIEIVTQLDKLVWDDYKESAFKISVSEIETWHRILHRVDSPSILSRSLMYYMAAHEKAEFAPSFALNGRIRNWDWNHGNSKKARLCLIDQSKANRDILFNQLDAISMLYLYSKTNLSQLSLYCFNVMLDEILPLNSFIGAREATQQKNKDLFIRYYSMRSLVLSKGACDRKMFFAMVHNFKLEARRDTSTISNMIESFKLVVENRHEQINTRVRIENGNVNERIEISEIEGYDIQRSRSNSRG